MDLTYVIGKDQDKLQKLEDLGCDLESLFFITKDLFSIIDDLGLTSKQAGEFLFRIKNAYDFSQGKLVDPDLNLYENHKTSPSRLSIENKSTGKTMFFRVIAGQANTDKTTLMLACEACADEQAIKRSDIKAHVQSRHDGLN